LGCYVTGYVTGFTFLLPFCRLFHGGSLVATA
jgi:hypothetical protein